MKKIIITVLFGVVGGVGILILDLRRRPEKSLAEGKAIANNLQLKNGDIIFQTSRSSQV